MRKLAILLILLAGCSQPLSQKEIMYRLNVKPHTENGIIMYHGTNKLEHNDTPGWCYYCDLHKEYINGTY